MAEKYNVQQVLATALAAAKAENDLEAAAQRAAAAMKPERLPTRKEIYAESLKKLYDSGAMDALSMLAIQIRVQFPDVKIRIPKFNSTPQLPNLHPRQKTHGINAAKPEMVWGFRPHETADIGQEQVIHYNKLAINAEGDKGFIYLGGLNESGGEFPLNASTDAIFKQLATVLADKMNDSSHPLTASKSLPRELNRKMTVWINDRMDYVSVPLVKTGA